MSVQVFWSPGPLAKCDNLTCRSNYPESEKSEYFIEIHKGDWIRSIQFKITSMNGH
jgi:hypothetical protein